MIIRMESNRSRSKLSLEKVILSSRQVSSRMLLNIFSIYRTKFKKESMLLNVKILSNYLTLIFRIDYNARNVTVSSMSRQQQTSFNSIFFLKKVKLLKKMTLKIALIDIFEMKSMS